MSEILAWFTPTRWLLLGGMILALLAAGWRIHHVIWEDGYDTAQAEYAKQAKTVDVARAAVAAPIAAKQDIIQTKIVTVTETITKEIPVYVKATDCPLSGGFRVLHDAAANGELPDPSRIVDAAAVDAQAAAQTIVANYGSCHSTEQRLIGLQEWVRAQQSLKN